MLLLLVWNLVMFCVVAYELRDSLDKGSTINNDVVLWVLIFCSFLRTVLVAAGAKSDG